ncbi:hypothetical protein B6R96_02910 [Streptomyces sp. Sge12]|nr:hypothetical protein B6R96_02910 [Streptomyces sp. Sge12]
MCVPACRSRTPGLEGLSRLRRPGDEASQPERVVERHAMRDWIWDAVEEPPQQMRLVVMLRPGAPATRSGRRAGGPGGGWGPSP